MKWSVVVLLVLGLVAAVSAALLVISMQGGGEATGQRPILESSENRETTYVVAARDLPARTVVETNAVEVRTASARDVPAGAYSQAAMVIGQVLRRPLKQGQAFDV